MSSIVAVASRVLLVEDDPADAEWARRALDDPNDVDAYGAIEVEHVNRLQTAVDRLSANQIHLVVLDLGLPDADNDERCVDQIHQATPSIPIIVFSGAPYEQSGRAVFDKGALYFFPKSSNDRKWFARTVRQALERYRMQENLRKIVEMSADGMAIFSPAGELLFKNPAARSIFGEQSDAPRYQAPFPLTRDQIERVDLGTSRVDIKLVRVEWFGRPAILASLRDVTRQLMTERQLYQAQKMEAVGLMAGGLAHDLNNVIGVISGFARMIRDELPPASRARENLDEIQLAGERASTLIRRLLAVSSPSQRESQPVNPDKLVESVMTLLDGVISDSRISLAASTSGGGRNVTVDASELEQAILNLVINARDAMPEGGEIRIETRLAELSETFYQAHPGLDSSNEHVSLSVSDTGEGMSDDVMGRVFEPFFTTKDPDRGSGLGLAMLYNFVKQSSGAVVVDSTVGSGTTFTIYLPCTRGTRPSTYKEVPAGHERILLVEDEPAIRRLAAQVLKAKNYTVAEADNPNQAQRLINDDEPFDLVVTDIALPGMTGPELVAAIKAQLPAMRVLYVSGHDRDAIVRQGVILDNDWFLQKPFTPLTLCLKVREVLDG